MSRHEQWLQLDYYSRKEFMKSEFKKKMLKSLIKNTKTPLMTSYYAFYNYTMLARSSSMTRPSNSCLVTGSQWMVVKKASYSSFVFRTNAYQGYLPGVRSSSW